MDNYTKLFDSLEDYNSSKYSTNFFPSVCKVKNADEFIPKYNGLPPITGTRIINGVEEAISYRVNNLKLYLDGILNYKDANENWSHNNSTTTWYNMYPVSTDTYKNGTGSAMYWANDHLIMRRESKYKPISLGYRNYTNYSIIYVVTPYYTNLTGDASEFFCTYDSGGVGMGVRSRDSNTGKLYIQQYNGSWKSFECTIPLVYGMKIHIAYTYNNTSHIGSLYLNGKFVQSYNFGSAIRLANAAGENAQSGTVAAIGSNPSGTNVTTTNTLPADIFSIKVYNTIITAEDIMNDFKYEKIRYDIPV